MSENPGTALRRSKTETREDPILRVEGLKTFFYSEEGQDNIKRNIPNPDQPEPKLDIRNVLNTLVGPGQRLVL